MKKWLTALFLLLAITNPVFARIIKPTQANYQIGEVSVWRKLSYEQQAVASYIAKVNNAGLTKPQIAEIVKLVYAHAERIGAEPARLLAIIRVESRFNPKAISNHGAKGIMQVMARVHKDKLKGRSPYNLEASVQVGSDIYKDCLERAKGNTHKALSYYSGGGGKAYSRLVLAAEKDLRNYTLGIMFADGPHTRPQQVALNDLNL